MLQKQNKKNSRTQRLLIVVALSIILMFFLVEYAVARYDDFDGHLKIFWSPPAYGNTPHSYVFSYTINGISDSVTGVSPINVQSDSSVILANQGDWAVFSIRAISTQGDTSTLAISDTAYFSGCGYTPGDVNFSGAFNGIDVTYSVTYFKGGILPPYSCYCSGSNWYVAGDVNGNCAFNGIDIIYMVSYFKGGPGLIPCPACPPGR